MLIKTSVLAELSLYICAAIMIFAFAFGNIPLGTAMAQVSIFPCLLYMGCKIAMILRDCSARTKYYTKLAIAIVICFISAGVMIYLIIYMRDEGTSLLGIIVYLVDTAVLFSSGIYSLGNIEKAPTTAIVRRTSKKSIK